MTTTTSPSTTTTVERWSVRTLAGPLLVADHAEGAAAGELVEVVGPDGAVRDAQVLELDGDRMILQVLGGTAGLDIGRTAVRSRARRATLAVGTDLLGRALDGAGRPLDDLPPITGSTDADLNGRPLNPVARDHPDDVIETGLSVIDALNTLVRGQKLPVFSGPGLPGLPLATRIATGATVPAGTGDDFVVVFAAMGLTRREAAEVRAELADTGALHHAVLFLNHADDPAIDRLLTPRAALTAAEHLAYEAGYHVLVVLCDMTAYCEALREVGIARGELPGRRGYPGYLYSDLASLYERAGRVRGRTGSVTQVPVVTMPDDDITHPIPDLTGYITEGQLVLSRELHRRGIAPAIDPLPSLSRLMNAGIGDGRTRADHRPLADQIYACYARGRDLRRLVAVVGAAALGDDDRRYLTFADDLETRFLHQTHRRTISETLDLAWELLDVFPPSELTRIPAAMLADRWPDPDR